MLFSSKVAQKAAAISDGSDTFKGALSISISCENIGARLRGFRNFIEAAFSILIHDSTTITFHDVGGDSWKREMIRVESTSAVSGDKS